MSTRRDKSGRYKATHGLGSHPLHIVWRNMMARCYKPSMVHYEHYGGRGVFVCDEWEGDFMNFYKWALENGWKRGLQLDKDVKGDGIEYSPSKCCFITPKENCNATKRNRYVIVDGEEMTVAQACRKLGLRYSFVYLRVSRGMTIQDAVTLPKQKPLGIIKHYSREAQATITETTGNLKQSGDN